MKAFRDTVRGILAKMTQGAWYCAGGYLTVRDPNRGSFVTSIYHIDELGQYHGRAFQAVPFAKVEDARGIATLRNLADERLDVAEAAQAYRMAQANGNAKADLSCYEPACRSTRRSGGSTRR